MLFPLGSLPSKIYIMLPFCCCSCVCPIAFVKPFGCPQKQPMICLGNWKNLLKEGLLSDDFLFVKYTKIEIKRILKNRTWLSISIVKRIWRKYAQMRKARSASNMLLYNYLIANSEIITFAFCSVFS